MSKFDRRNFLKLAGLSAFSFPLMSFQSIEMAKQHPATKPKVQFTRDGLDHSPEEYAALLVLLTKDNALQTDSYSNGGVVAALEEKFAKMLGTESAIFMPTGTLANHIAIRKHAGDQRKVIVQAESHIYNDSGDCAQTISSLNLMPLGEGETSFSLDDVQKAIARAEHGRVKTEVGCISIESPVRRTDNQMFDFDEMQAISQLAKQKGIKMHLDGARLFNAVAHSGLDVQQFTQLFDTVYVSLYKNFNAASGAILAGTKEFCEGLFHTRRMFGGGMPQVWAFAAVALDYADTFMPEYQKALLQFAELEKLIKKENRFRIEKITNGTNVFRFFVDTTDMQQFRRNLASENIILPAPTKDQYFKLKINNTLNNRNMKDLLVLFNKAL